MARAERSYHSAMRAAATPAMLTRALQIVHAGLATGRVSLGDLDGPVIRPPLLLRNGHSGRQAA